MEISKASVAHKRKDGNGTRGRARREEGGGVAAGEE